MNGKPVAAQLLVTAYADGSIGLQAKGSINLTGILGALEQAKLMAFANQTQKDDTAIEPPPNGFRFAVNGK